MGVWRQLLILLVVAGAGAGAWAAYDRWGPAQAQAPGGRPGGAVQVETATAQIQTLTTRVEAVGSTIARRSVEIVPLAAGRIASLGFTAGDEVAEGQILATLDSDLERADLAEAEASLLKARLELDRGDSLRRSNVTSNATVEDLTANLAIAQAAVDRAQRRLADRTIRAPFPGTVGLTRLDVGAYVTPATVITSLDDLTAVEIDFKAPERLFGIARLGQPIEALSAAYPGRVFSGEVIEIDSRVDAVSRAFALRARVPNMDGALPAGMFMTLAMTLESSDALVIPEQAVVAEAGAASVFVVEGARVRRVPITVGRREVGIAEVLSGLTPGAEVVISGVGKLRDGAAVQVANTAAKTAAAPTPGVTQ